MEKGHREAASSPDDREKIFHKYLKFESFVKGGRVEPHWMADGNSFWYAEGAPDQTIIYKVDPQANSKAPLLDTDRLRGALTPELGHEPPYRGLPFQTFEFIEDEKGIKFTIEDRQFTCQLDTYHVTALPPLSEKEKSRTTPRSVRRGFLASVPDVMEVRSPDGAWFAGTKEHNLYLRSAYDGRAEPLTSDGIQDYEWDVDGAQWSPDSLKLAAKKLDTRDVLRVPILHWLKPTEEVEWAPYSKAGGPLPRTELYIVDILSKRPIRVDIGDETDHHIQLMGWRPDGSELLFYRVDRTWKKLDLMAANPATGETRVIVSEEQDTFVLGISYPNVQLTTLFEDGNRFVWRSERDGWAHLYLYDIQGNLLRRLTEGSFPVVGVVTLDEEAGWVYFTAHAEERLYDTHLYRVDFDGKGFQRLTEAEGQHEIQFAPSKAFFVDNHSSTERHPSAELRSGDGALLQKLAEANIDALQELNWSPPEEFIVKAADEETDLYGVLYKPSDFDPAKKYPVIDHIYNGPQTTWVPRVFTDPKGILAAALAQMGFLVFIVDGRGTVERGKKFNDIVYRNFGRNEIPDHVATLQQLAKERPYMDTERVGIFGGSWGGYMTVRAMLLAPDVYHVGIATNPVYDLYDHMARAIEPYMDLPHENREGYEYASSLKMVGNLKGKLLLVHATCDVNATFSATMKMVEALIRAGKPYDLIVLPDQDHHPTGTSRTYWLDAMRRYFEEHLEP